MCSIYRISGEYDMDIIGKLHNTKQLDEWTKRMLQDTDFIERTNTSLVFRIVNERTVPNQIE